MRVFQDLLTGDEMVSEAFPMKVVDDTVYEVNCAMTIYESADGEPQGGPVNNVVKSFSLQPTTFDKKSYLAHVKSYFRALKSKHEELGQDTEMFVRDSQSYLKKTILPNFAELSFYTGSSQNADGMVALLRIREDGVTPFFTFWKGGLEEVTM